MWTSPEENFLGEQQSGDDEACQLSSTSGETEVLWKTLAQQTTADMRRLLSRNYWFLEALEQLGSETSWDFVRPSLYRMAAP